MWRKYTIYPTDSAFIDHPEVVDKSERLFGKTAPSWVESRIQQSLRSSPCDGHNANERKTLFLDHLGITHDDAGPNTFLLPSYGGTQVHYDDCASREFHLRLLAHPLPGIHRIGFSARLSRRPSASSFGRLCAHSSNPLSTKRAVSGCGFRRDRRSSSRRRRSNSRRTASATNRLRFFSCRSMSLMRLSGRVTVTRSIFGISYSQYDHTPAVARQ